MSTVCALGMGPVPYLRAELIESIVSTRRTMIDQQISELLTTERPLTLRFGRGATSNAYVVETPQSPSGLFAFTQDIVDTMAMLDKNAPMILWDPGKGLGPTSMVIPEIPMQQVWDRTPKYRIREYRCDEFGVVGHEVVEVRPEVMQISVPMLLDRTRFLQRAQDDE